MGLNVKYSDSIVDTVNELVDSIDTEGCASGRCSVSNELIVKLYELVIGA